MIIGSWHPRSPKIRFKHYYREVNRVANHLARKGAKQNADFILFENLPVDLLAIFNYDLVGLYLSRHCPVETLSI